MRPEERCEQTRELLTELALGVADGEDRAVVLAHAADCADCRRELEAQAGVADRLLLLAPEQEPPLGFELSVLRSIEPPAPKRAAVFRRLALVGAVLAAVAITAGGMLLGFRDDRQLADRYRAALAEANGTYFGSRRLADAAGRPGGVVFAYRGSPSWILVTVEPRLQGSVERAVIFTRSGRRTPLASFRLTGGTWGGALPVDLSEVAAVHLVSPDGSSALVGEF